MNQDERRLWLIEELLKERPDGREIGLPTGKEEQKRLLRALFNIRPPRPAPQAFLDVQDAYLREETRQKGVTDAADLAPVQKGIYLWQGDITTLKCDAIVNAANAQMLGCFAPCHGCIDNAIHTYAGVQLRLACQRLMEQQGHEEPVGNAKITPGFNLPCRYVLHTVGPYIAGKPGRADEERLAACYRSCLALAEEHGLSNVAFCCISTGEFHFPNQRAAEIAVQTVKDYIANAQSGIEVIFVVYKDVDLAIYRQILG